ARPAPGGFAGEVRCDSQQLRVPASRRRKIIGPQVQGAHSAQHESLLCHGDRVRTYQPAGPGVSLGAGGELAVDIKPLLGRIPNARCQESTRCGQKVRTDNAPRYTENISSCRHAATDYEPGAHRRPGGARALRTATTQTRCFPWSLVRPLRE